jgi:3-dehydroquinate dehydratase I
MICVPLKTSSESELVKKLQKVPKNFLVEIWVDNLNLKAEKILSLSRHKKIIVNKPKREKGTWSGSEKERIARLIEFISPLTAYIDIGIDTDIKLIKQLAAEVKKSPAKLIVSYHDFKKTPALDDLDKIIQKAKKLRADIVKIATYARTKSDNIRLMQLYDKHKIPLIVLAMGPLGKISRINNLYFGAHINYIALDQKDKTANGQLTLSEYKLLKKIIKI